MPNKIIHVTRGEAQLGVFVAREVRELLASGFLKASDDAWMAGMADWQPLGDVLAKLPTETSTVDWRDKVIIGSTAISRLIGQRAGKFVADAKARAAEQPDDSSSAKPILLDVYLPQFKRLLAEYLRDKPANALKSATHDEVLMKKLFGALYDCLPKPILRFVPEADFIKFCMDHRQYFVEEMGKDTEQTAPKPSTAETGRSAEGEALKG